MLEILAAKLGLDPGLLAEIATGLERDGLLGRRGDRLTIA